MDIEQELADTVLTAEYKAKQFRQSRKGFIVVQYLSNQAITQRENKILEELMIKAQQQIDNLGGV